jgi:hypothetical protein
MTFPVLCLEGEHKTEAVFDFLVDILHLAIEYAIMAAPFLGK